MMNTLTKSQKCLDSLNARTKRLEGYAYKLTGSSYGTDVSLPDKLDIDTNKMSAWIPFADGRRRDGVGDLLEVGGIRLERHQKNPIVLFDHGKNVTLPIAMAAERDTNGVYNLNRYTVELDTISRTGRLNAFFYSGKGMSGVDRKNEYDHAVFTEQLYDMMAKRLLGAGSIGYQVVKALPLQANYEEGYPQGMHLLVTLMLEGSLVILPANMDTVGKVLGSHQWCGKRLSPYLVKSLEPYAPVKKATLITGDKGIPVPLRELPKSKIPPVKWKPGLGAIKAQIAGDLNWLKEEEKEAEHKNLGSDEPRIQSDPPKRDVITGQVLNNKPQSQQDKTNTHTPCKGCGDTRKKIRVSGDGSEGKGSICPTCKRTEPGDSKEKSMSELRNQYRNTKGLGRRLRRSKPGSSMCYVKKADLDKIKALAKQRGLSADWRGTHSSGLEKVRLTGDDKAIDGVVHEFGRPLKPKVGFGKAGTKSDRVVRDASDQWNRRKEQDRALTQHHMEDGVHARERHEEGKTPVAPSKPSNAEAYVSTFRNNNGKSIEPPKPPVTPQPAKAPHQGRGAQPGESYLNECPRDESGHCLPKGQAGHTKQKKKKPAKKKASESQLAKIIANEMNAKVHKRPTKKGATADVVREDGAKIATVVGETEVHNVGPEKVAHW